MKKVWSVMIAFVFIILTFAMPVFSAGPSAPVILTTVPDCYLPMDGSPANLFVDAESQDGGTLEYQWYRTTVNDISTIKAINYATSNVYVASYDGYDSVVYYCCGVWNVWDENMKSAPTYSRLIRVEFFEESPKAVSLEILSVPNKTVYISGEKLDLTGLRVRVWTPEGYFDSINGEGLEITKNSLVTVGEQKILVKYEDVSDVFLVMVKAASTATTAKSAVTTSKHIHVFGEWSVEKEATCTQEGRRVRICSCGEKEYETIAMVEHDWGTPIIVKEATPTEKGEEIVTCRVCGATQTLYVSINVDEHKMPETTTSAAEISSFGTDAPSDSTSGGGLQLWVIAVIAVAAVVAVAAIAVIILIFTKQKKK